MTQKTTVEFRKFEDGEVIALFPDIYFNNYVSSYMHIGQHGEADKALLNELPEAEYFEYSALLKELIRIGYNLEVITSQMITAQRQPTAAETSFGYGATHYAEFNLAQWLKRDGSIKKWLKGDDGLRYYR